MHLGLQTLARFFERHRHDEPLVLATVTATSGSTYRKAGALMLIDEAGDHAGMISGGCLEDDLAGHARAVFADGSPRRVDYDLHDDPELVLGLGLGCGGDVHVLLTRLDEGDGRDVIANLFRAVAERRFCRLGLVLESVSARCAKGALALIEAPGPAAAQAAGRPSGNPELANGLAGAAAEHPEAPSARGARTEILELDLGGDRVRALVVHVPPPARVLICGAGPDAVPVAVQVRALGWQCTVVDHRPAYADSGRFPAGTRALCHRSGRLPGGELDGVDAAIVMSHHLEHDEHWLRQLTAHPPPYIGLLGPARRRTELLGRLGDDAPAVHGPAGLDIGAELPEAIALSIMAEIHARLNGRDGGFLTDV